jgi:hypothetical protein
MDDEKKALLCYHFFSQIFLKNHVQTAKKKRFHETSHFYNEKGGKAVTTINKKGFGFFAQNRF